MDSGNEYSEFLEWALKGDRQAIYFVEMMTQILHTWDDIVDDDNDLQNGTVNQAFWDAMIELPRCEFYVRNFTTLQPLLINAILDWETANSFENEGDDLGLEIAFVIRSSYLSMVIMSAYLIGGRQWALEVSPQARRICSQEGFSGYIENLKTEKKNRLNRRQ